MVLAFLAAAAGLAAGAAPAEGQAEFTNTPVTSLADLLPPSSVWARANRPVHLEGVICWLDAAQNLLILQDNTGAALIETQTPSLKSLQAGERVVLDGDYVTGDCGASLGVADLSLVQESSVGGKERGGSILLKAGKHPIVVTWHDGGSPMGLGVFYDSTNLMRRSIPDSALFHAEVNPATGQTNWLPGVAYGAFEGPWPGSPDFEHLAPVRKGFTNNFNLEVRTRDRFAGLAFRGWLEVPRDAQYNFSIASPGGDQLVVEHPRFQILGAAGAPVPVRIGPGQPLARPEPPHWAEVEGVVTYIGKDPSPWFKLELTFGAEHMDAEIADLSRNSYGMLLNSRVRITGICRSSYSQDGQAIVGKIWAPGLELVELLDVAPELWTANPIIAIGALKAAPLGISCGGLAHLRGKVCSLGPGRSLAIDDGTGQIQVKLAHSPLRQPGERMEVLGTLERAGGEVLLRDACCRKVENAGVGGGPLPVLTTAKEVKQLKREEAMRGYPVRLRGIITWSGGSGAVVQDSTMGVFVDDFKPDESASQRFGDYWEVEGQTTAQFSPMVRAGKVTRLGEGRLPEPVHPTWDQLINGSLDTQYVEMQGVVTAIENTGLWLLTHGGKIHVALPEKRSVELKRYENALIRLRGCLWAVKDEVSHLLKVGEVQMHDPFIEVDREPPADPFAAPAKRVADLLLFDVKAGAFQQIKVAGQIVHERDGEFYLMDGTNGLRFSTTRPVPLQTGDRLEVSGFPVLGGPSPVLREAVVRRVGNGPLPAPTALSPDRLLSPDYDSTLVKVRAQLVNLGVEQRDLVLGMQQGTSMFVARLNVRAGRAVSLPVGSVLELTGVYVGRGGDRSVGQNIDSFELLLNSAAAIEVLERPSWWTMERMLVMVTVLVGILALASVWIWQLRRLVAQRTAELGREIEERERVEHQHALEEERARIARDLHDALGSSLTEISMLADAGAGRPPSLEKAGARFQTIVDKARSVVGALDVIVWLVNPGKNQLQFLVSYLVSYAEDYLSGAGIAHRVHMPSEIPELTFVAEIRHSLFLAQKETLHNVVRHSGATEVVIDVTLNETCLTITTSDNGCGFDLSNPAEGNGLGNLRKRMSDLDGRCEIVSVPGQGTKVALVVPLPGRQDN